MRIYKVKFRHRDLGTCLAWATSKRKAEQFVRKTLRDLDDPDEVKKTAIELMHIPTDAQGLTRWLNLHFEMDNG